MENIRVEQLLKLERTKIEEYTEVFKYVNPKDRIKIGFRKWATGRDFWKLSFDNVAIIKKRMNAGNITRPVSIAFGITEKQVLKMRVKEYFYALAYVRTSLEKITKAEKEHLSSEPDSVLTQAGIERMSIFKELNVLIPLARRYGMTTEQVSEWSYGKVFNESLFDKVSGEIEKAAMEIRHKQNK